MCHACHHCLLLAALRYALSGASLFKASLRRDWTLVKRNSFLYIFKTCQVRLGWCCCCCCSSSTAAARMLQVVSYDGWLR
jgi:hypothetical protein